MKKIYNLITVLFLSSVSFAQAPFWTENFGTGCGTGQLANGFNPGQGVWTQSLTGANDMYPNVFYISAEEGGMGIGNCGGDCGASGNNKTLHISTDVNIAGDVGAAYSAFNGLCNSNVRIQSPVINCTGQNNISLTFAYILGGIPGNGYFDVQYSANGGTTWSVIATPAQTANGPCAPQGLWTGYTVTLPATANNNSNVKIGFRWQNSGNAGTDPSVALDDISLVTTTPATFAPTFTLSTPICQGNTQTLTANTGTFAVSGYTWSTSPSGPTFGTPNASVTTVNYPTAGTFSITLTATSGGTTTGSTQTVVVNATPVPTVMALPASICTGQSSTLSCSGPTNFTWSPGGANTSSIAVSPSITTTYTLVGASVAGCTVSSVITLTVGSSLSVSLSANPFTICAGSSATLTANGGTSYTWNPGAQSGNTIVASPTVNTIYTVNAANGACTGSNVITLTVTNCSTAGMISYALNNTYKVYPNPTSDKLFIQASESISGDVTIDVIDALGKVMIKQNHSFGSSSNASLNVNLLPSGMYFVKITSASKETKVIRFVKE